MPGLVPGIHVFNCMRQERRGWAGGSPPMTDFMLRLISFDHFFESACHAARTELRNLPTSRLSRLLSPDSDFAAASTCDDADPVSLAPRCTSAMLEETC